MSTAIRAEVGIASPEGCPVATASDGSGARVESVSRSVAAGPEGTLAEEFTVDADAGIGSPDVESVFEFGSRTLFRFEREPGGGCVCECIERAGCPASEVHARDGTLFVAFHAPDLDTLHEVVDGLEARFGNVRVHQITTAEEWTDHDFAVVDRTRLTDRQREVLEVAHEMGYFEHPKGANASEVAAALGVARSTFAEHLAAAQRKVLESVVRS